MAARNRRPPELPRAHRRGGAWVWLGAVLLVLGQWAGLWHAQAHGAHGTSAVAVADATPTHGHDEGGHGHADPFDGHAPGSADCLLLDQLLHVEALGAACPPDPAPRAVDGLPTRAATTAARTAPSAPYLARAPPSALA